MISPHPGQRRIRTASYFYKARKKAVIGDLFRDEKKKLNNP